MLFNLSDSGGIWGMISFLPYMLAKTFYHAQRIYQVIKNVTPSKHVYVHAMIRYSMFEMFPW